MANKHMKAVQRKSSEKCKSKPQDITSDPVGWLRVEHKSNLNNGTLLMETEMLHLLWHSLAVP